MNPSFDAQSARDPRLQQQVLDRAASDTTFRGRLLAEPHAAIRDAFGVQVPESFRLKFVERTPDIDALVVLPNVVSSRVVAPDTAGTHGELDEASLETVAGGWSPSGDGAGSGAQTEGGDWEGGTWW